MDSFDLGIMASTPLKKDEESFLSPMAKLNKLHLESPGNQTLYEQDLPNSRKRHHSDSPSDMIITPSHSNSKMSIINSSSFNKSSFSSDSTPCPVQPRKKLKFKMNRNRVLNFSDSVKTKLDDEVSAPNTSVFSKNPQSTPISQSTPANSNAGTPKSQAAISEDSPAPASPEPGDDSISPQDSGVASPYQEYGDPINGFHFVGKTTSTPILPSHNMKQAYNQGNLDAYSIIGEIEPNDDLHIGDRRADPYQESDDQSDEDSDHHLRERYLSETKPPLMRCFVHPYPTKQEILDLINDNESIVDFLSKIYPSQNLVDVIKSERIKWHPDKWQAKLPTPQFDAEIINSLSQALNAILERYL